jgi:hypothetical protein
VTREIRFFAYNGSGGKVRVLKIIKQIQTNVKQNNRNKKNETFKLFRLVGAVDICPQTQLMVFGIV